MDLYLTPCETCTPMGETLLLKRWNLVSITTKKRERDWKYMSDGDLGEEMLHAV